MGGRYVITGTQIGVLSVLVEKYNDAKIKNVLSEVEDQFIADSENALRYDLQALQNRKQIQELCSATTISNSTSKTDDILMKCDICEEHTVVDSEILKASTYEINGNNIILCTCCEDSFIEVLLPNIKNDLKNLNKRLLLLNIDDKEKQKLLALANKIENNFEGRHFSTDEEE